MSGIIGQETGAKSGTVNQTPVDYGVDGWFYTLGTGHSGSGVLDLDTVVHKGANISESGGIVTVNKAGWYLVCVCLSNDGSSTTACQMHLGVNGHSTSEYRSQRMYFAGTGMPYYAEPKTTLVYLASGDALEVYMLEGALNGHPTWYTSMTGWTGFWVGV